jgi:hypothetical protein
MPYATLNDAMRTGTACAVPTASPHSANAHNPIRLIVFFIPAT